MKAFGSFLVSLLIPAFCLAQAGFTLPDTVCVNTPVSITNTTNGASTYYWSFCVADVNQAPTALNLGNPGNALSMPVFVDLAEDNGNFYGFVVDHNPGGITRLDFGNSLLNNPTAVYLGNIGGVMNAHYGNEGIQIVKANGNWYGILVGGSPASQTVPKLITFYFGPSLNNPSPTAKDWGNVGGMLEPIDLHVFEENGNWYGFTVNSEDNSITRFNFTNSFDNPPTGVNLGNIGQLSYPTGVYAIKDAASWHVFVTNGISHSITRLDFGSSLLNTPTGVNLGNPSNLLAEPRDITFINYCGHTAGFVANHNGDDIIQLSLSSLTDVPTGVSLGNIGNLSFPHSLSKMFRVGNDIYSLIPNVNNNTITRLKFSGCTSSSLANSTLKDPPSPVYSTPGVYNINLTIDDGLATQSAFCKQVVVIGAPPHLRPANINLCSGDSIRLGASVKAQSYIWSTGASSDSIFVKNASTYWVDVNRYGCFNRDSFLVAGIPSPSITSIKDTTICKGTAINIPVQGSGSYSYSWLPSTGLSDPNSSNPSAQPSVTTSYIVTATSTNNCRSSDTVQIIVKPLPMVQLGNDTAICRGDSIVLKAGNTRGIFQWQDGSSSNTFVARDSGTYTLKVTDNGCWSADTLKLAVHPLPVFSIRTDTAICARSPIVLATFADSSYSYNWHPSTGLSDPHSNAPDASFDYSMKYFSTARNSFGCTATDSVTITRMPLPTVNLGADTLLCSGHDLTLDAGNAGSVFLWNSGGTAETYTVHQPGTYTVKVTDRYGCSASDTVYVRLKLPGKISISPDSASMCALEPVTIRATGGDQYEWFTNTGNLNFPDSVITLAPASTTDYFVKITDRVCGSADTLKTHISVKPAPQVHASKSNDVNCATPAAQLSATGGVAYYWTPAVDISNPNIGNPGVYPKKDTWYKVEGLGANGCKGVDSVQVITKYAGVGTFYVPNAFTPNNDGKNDCFGVRYWGASTTFEMSVYNRWGERVFYTQNLQDCWNGYFKGQLQPNGVYVYIIKVNGPCGNASRKGTVLLIR